ncbi:aspartate-semialdehyde dehydrogenase [Chryseobacterium polytrichastri]|uniref:Aspartate-semialdehyde dehydrogenase n=1 Tax=Chryseobacterium polytrichastri TaxID=1302687 RepID=A0A1M6X1G3_9FLAO|nr:aspartate-semialdehyde dehydrogenase [Chryseobacterium polytrichastri]SHK99731.1 aspartate-semialdehyde dehydrogenase [Chryseobacterium polytrichastri]
MKVAVVGSTGMVGQVMLKVLEERNFPITELIPVASERSIGKQVKYKQVDYTIVSIDDAIAAKPDIALFSAGGSTSLEYAPKFAEAGITVIDNSSAWRMDPDKKLVVPEINADVLTKEDKIIANPNCSTIQLVMVLGPLNKIYDLKRVIVSTYQSVTGTGKAAVDQLNGEINGDDSVAKVYPYQIFKNALPHCDVFSDDDYTKEEIKLMKEPKKILGDDTFNLTATAVRVPVQGGHSESVNIEFENEFELDEVRKILAETPGVIVMDNVKNNEYPMPLYSEGKDEVFVGRIRRDLSQPKTLNLWIVADNLRKGAATNAVQIAEYLVANNLV